MTECLTKKWTINDVINSPLLPRIDKNIEPSPPPLFLKESSNGGGHDKVGDDDSVLKSSRDISACANANLSIGLSCPQVGLAVSSMAHHTTNEGWELFLGLRHAGYIIAGHGCDYNEINVDRIITRLNPDTVFVQDHREWDIGSGRLPVDFRDPLARFINSHSLSHHPDIFKVTVLKDAHQRTLYHKECADSIGCHAWVVYYHPAIVKRLAPYVREQHVIRTYHSVDSSIVPEYTHPSSPRYNRNKTCLLSGAVSGAYPLRSRLFREHSMLPGTDLLRHPGYHRNGSATPRFLQTLAQYKVAICTASVYGYALRKIIEATACGCVVITDLPCDEVLPKIDANLIRVDPDVSTKRIAEIISLVVSNYDHDRQQHLAEAAKAYYDYRVVGSRLASDIKSLRSRY